MDSTVAYFKNGIGNWVLMTPALRAMASMTDSGTVDMVIDGDWSDSRTPAILDLVESSPFVGKIMRYPSQALNPRKYGRWFYSRHSEGSAALQFFETKNPTTGHRINWRASLVHEMDYYMNIARMGFGYKGETPLQYVKRLDSLPAGVARAFDSRNRWVALCNGGFARMRGPKCWPHFNELASALRKRYGVSIVGVGAKGELAGVKLDLDLTGELSILETARVLCGEVDHFVTTDTGLMHIADALEVNMTVLFGGSIVSKNGPVNHTATIVRADLGCVPCQYVGDFEKCRDPQCMSRLKVGQVMRALSRWGESL